MLAVNCANAVALSRNSTTQIATIRDDPRDGIGAPVRRSGTAHRSVAGFVCSGEIGKTFTGPRLLRPVQPACQELFPRHPYSRCFIALPLNVPSHGSALPQCLPGWL